MEKEQTTQIVSELEQKSVAILDWLEKSVQQTTNFVADQTPIFIQELLTWNFVISLVWFSISIILYGLLIKQLHNILVKNSFEFKPNELDGDGDLYLIPGLQRIFIVFLMIISFIVATVNINLDWLKIKMAPRVYLLEYGIKNLKK